MRRFYKEFETKLHLKNEQKNGQKNTAVFLKAAVFSYERNEKRKRGGYVNSQPAYMPEGASWLSAAFESLGFRPGSWP
ncbi:MAG: hypothetical protein LUE11_12040 [Clostridia bacterium]|nr:hypothetical protein [Clostridia bacterium]